MEKSQFEELRNGVQEIIDFIAAKDNEIFEVGDIKIKVLHTPGHTMESTTFLLIDADGKDYAIFSGDTLFLGDVGRPDLAQKAAHMTQEQLAEKVGTKKSYISRLENGRCDIQLSTLYRIFEFGLGKKINLLIG